MPRDDADDDRDDAPPPRRRRRDHDSDRDEPGGRPRSRRTAREEDDGPRRRKSTKKGSNLPIVLGAAAVAGVLLLAACGIGLYYLVSPKPGTTGPPQNAGAGGGGAQTPAVTLPAGWVEFNDPRNEIRLFWPGGQPTRGPAPGGAADAETWTQTYRGKKYTLIRSPLTAAEARPERQAAGLENAVAGMLSALPGATEVRKNTETEGGHQFRVSTIDVPQTHQRVFARLTVVKGQLVILTITAPQNNVFWATEPDTAPFFQSLWPK